MAGKPASAYNYILELMHFYPLQHVIPESNQGPWHKTQRVYHDASVLCLIVKLSILIIMLGNDRVGYTLGGITPGGIGGGFVRVGFDLGGSSLIPSSAVLRLKT